MSIEVKLVHNCVNRSRRRRQMMKAPENSEKLLTPSEVAALFRVDPKTVTRWAKAGKLSSIRTLGGHRRYRESEIRELIEVSTQE
jgi:excisionase family DNA binding protein